MTEDEFFVSWRLNGPAPPDRERRLLAQGGHPNRSIDVRFWG